MATETLIGGPRDGQEVERLGSGVVICGQFGDRLVSIYERLLDGRLHHTRTVVAYPSQPKEIGPS